MTSVEWLEDCLTEQYPNGKFVWNTRADIEALFKRAKEMEKQQIIDFINWLHLNQYKYNPKAKLYQKHFINETLFFSIDELYEQFKNK